MTTTTTAPAPVWHDDQSDAAAAPQAVTRRTDNAEPHRTATLTMQGWENLARSLFGWRTRAGYATWHGRIQALGSHDYDRLVIAAAAITAQTEKESAR